MNLREIEERVGVAQAAEEPQFLFELLRAYDVPKASITRLRSGSYNRSRIEGEYLWRNKVYYRLLDCDDDELYTVVDAAKGEERIVRERPRFAIARNVSRLVAVDLKTGDALDIGIQELRNHAAFFLPWAGIEKTQLESQNLADVKAAEKMARLYDEIVKHNAVETEEQIHELNVFFSRLLFCFFAEDTGIFEKGSFTNAIGSLSLEDGKDLHELLDQIFDVLNTEEGKRIGYPSHLLSFGYVNGRLFERHSSAPRFTKKARSLALDSGTLDWSQINPDIFGSMIQAVVHPGQRGKLGMHYTSVENIMKVLRPLFLDEMKAEFEAAKDSIARLERLHDRLATIQVFDPACGSGNFLVIAYKELRRLEHRILERIAELEPSKRRLFDFSRIHLDNFYGVEIDDFAHEVATLSLWLAKHQMNLEFKERFGVEIPLIPLTEAGNIICGNAAQLDWRGFCDPERAPTFVLGNPPYAGSSMQNQEQKEDFMRWFGSTRYPKKLDYISLWFLKGADYVSSSSARLGFVATSSIAQGDHVGYLWPLLLERGVEVSFAYEPFRWVNQARGQAGVTCTIIGLRAEGSSNSAELLSERGRRTVSELTPYLVPGRRALIVKRQSRQISGLPPMITGCKLSDGGHLVLSSQEKEGLLQGFPAAAPFVKRYMGGAEMLNGSFRWCLYIRDADLATALQIQPLAERVEKVRAFRESSTEKSTREMAKKPHRFYFDCYSGRPSFVVPSTTSERREYVPVGIADGETVVSNAANLIFGTELWLFGLIQSRMHMAWLRAVGGRMKTDYRYSAVLVYNTFPVPELAASEKDALKMAAVGVLGARERFSDRTLAELYDPDKMPVELLDAHAKLDEAVDRFYRSRPFESDEERLKALFALYEETAERGAAHA